MLPKEAVDDGRVLALITTLSTTLSNLDAEFQFEVTRVRSSARPDVMSAILDTIRRRHMLRREPYVLQIAELRRHVASDSPRQAHGPILAKAPADRSRDVNEST